LSSLPLTGISQSWWLATRVSRGAGQCCPER
jgi:hypothetical protein